MTRIGLQGHSKKKKWDDMVSVELQAKVGPLSIFCVTNEHVGMSEG